MSDVTIENPILNSPYEEPRRHFRFEADGITNDVVETRRVSSYFMPIAATRKKGKQQLAFDTEWTKDRVEENKFINRVRGRVALWRQGGYTGITKTTRQLLEYWQRPGRDRRLFFCQIEAMETAIYIAEVANKYGDSWIENELRTFNEDANPLLYRIAIKMATGSGKTVVMAMLIAWQVLNKKANTQDARFTDAFLVVTPGITIKDRLRVLLPNDPNNFYRAMDIVSTDWLTLLQETKIIITNFHTLRLKERGDAARLTKQILNAGETSAFTETPGQMARRVCRDLGSKKNIIVINDEAHHCYRRRAGGETAEEALKGEDRREAEKREEEARIWISGLEAIKAKIGIKAIYDLSATPFFLRGSGYQEGTLFPWVVSDFSLIDAIESGIVKVPRVPVADDAMQREGPMYRDLWLRIRDDLPKKGRKTEEVGGEPKLPVELEGALKTLYDHYTKVYTLWADDPHARENSTPPVFIVVCQNTNISKLVFEWIAGWEKPVEGRDPLVVPGQLDLFSNESSGGWSARPSTILVDSTQLESDEAMSAEFKKIAAAEIEKFKWEYKARTGRDPEELTDKDILREVMNTVGKKDKLGENVKCVVSVSMLTEGWDANTVTHILGVRAFGTQLLCEQVIGRGLRRRSYVLNDDGHFDPEYAEVYGVPFSFIPCAGAQKQPRLGAVPTRVKALEERAHLEITFPRLAGYRYELPGEKLTATFTEDSVRVLSTEDIPTKTENAPIVGETVIMTLDDLKARREQEVAFLLAKRTLEKYFRDEEGNLRQWLFPQLLGVARRWLAECVRCKDNTFPQLLLLVEFADDAAGRIYRAIVASTEGQKTLMPVLTPYDTVGSTRYVDFDTTKATYQTGAEKCHVSHVVCDSNWEAKMAQSLEDMDEVVSYVKNETSPLSIPYTLDGQEKSYIPDFIVRIDLTRVAHGPSPSTNPVAQGPSPESNIGPHTPVAQGPSPSTNPVAQGPSPESNAGSPHTPVAQGPSPESNAGPSPSTNPVAQGPSPASNAGNFLNLIIEVTGEKRKDKETKSATAKTMWVPAVNNHGGFGRWAYLQDFDPWNAQNAIREFLAELE